jgi:hypothetical protein
MTTYLETELAYSPTPEVRHRYDPPIAKYVEMDWGWLESQQRISASATHAFSKAAPTDLYGEKAGFSGDLFGEGQSMGPTLSVLDFLGEQGRYGEASDEFEFIGYGRVRTLGEPPRDVEIKGIATRYFGESTPFLQHFRGHAVVNERYTWPNMPNAYRVRGVIESASKRRVRHSAPSRAYEAFKELATWLEMTDDELATIIDISRTTVSMSWKKGVEPHNKAKARRLYELHSVVSTLHQILGSEFTGWLKRGRPCPLRLLEQQKYESFERRADKMIFPASSEPRRRLDTAWQPRSEEGGRAMEPQQLKPAGRARSKRLAR